VTWHAPQEWLAGTRLARCVADTVLRGRARRHLAALDQQPAARAQAHVLAGLVRRAQHTPFGREHDFGRIRTADDFRRLVPLSRSPANGEPAAPALQATREAVWTALAFVLAVRPRARLCRGRILFVGGELPLTPDTAPAPGEREGRALGSCRRCCCRTCWARRRTTATRTRSACAGWRGGAPGTW